jgi:hypothetical protein
MEFTLILSLIKLGLEVFQDERKDRYLKKYLKIEKAYYEELNKGLENRSDLVINKLRLDARQLAKLVVREASKR